MNFAKPLILCLLSLIPSFALAADEDDPLSGLTKADFVFTGKLQSVAAGPVGLSFPPVYTHSLTFAVDQVFRGEIRPKTEVTLQKSTRQKEEPKFPEGKICLVIGRKSRGNLVLDRVEVLDMPLLNKARLASSLPVGWRLKGDEILSPWARQNQAWPASEDFTAAHKCAVTGRPALLMPAAAGLVVEPVPPKREIKWTNPDGDGQYRVVVRNPTDGPLTIPALLRSGEEILWEQSLLILCQNQVYTLSEQPLPAELTSVTLKKGETVSTVIQALALEGPEWPRGGYRIEFQFALGQKSHVESFYYLSRHHDGIRAALKKQDP